MHVKDSISLIAEQMLKISELAELQATLTEELNASAEDITAMTYSMLNYMKNS